MALILNIDTSSSNSFVFLADNDKILASEQNDVAKNHASFIQPAIQKLFLATGLSINEIDAVAVVAGPGSYTGLRVGVATAKGLCYALNKPLIFINTLLVIAAAAIEENIANHQPPTINPQPPTPNYQLPTTNHKLPTANHLQSTINIQPPTTNYQPQTTNFLYCPMMDARRMEVFTAIYDLNLAILEEATALIVTETSFEAYLEKGNIVFCGDGSKKFKALCQHPNAIFSVADYHVNHILKASFELYIKNKFVDLAYSEPIYLKEFFSNIKKK